MESFDPRETGFYRSFAKNSSENERDKHTSAPKRKGSEPNEPIHSMKKSMMVGNNKQKGHSILSGSSASPVKWW